MGSDPKISTEDYLFGLLGEDSDWMEQNGERLEEALRFLVDLYGRERETLPKQKESNTETRFIRPVLENVLGFALDSMDDHPDMTVGGQQIQPDLVFFASEADYREVLGVRDSEPHKYFQKALCIVESEAWNASLFKRSPDSARRGRRRRTPVQNRQTPFNQIKGYLHSSGVTWGILTNGSQWVLVPREQRERSPTYVLFNLEHLLQNPADEESLKAFRLFVFLLEKEAFVGWQRGESRLDRICAQNLQKQAQVEAGLHARVYPALLALSQGLHSYLRSIGRPETAEEGRRIYSASLYLLYRLLFIFFAESRGLLRVGDERYSIIGLREQSKDAPVKWTPRRNSISVIFSPPTGSFQQNTYAFHSNLKELFTFVDGGNANWGLPPYNGDLFKQRNWPKGPDDLRIADYYIGIALHLLGYRYEGGQLLTVDYQNLGVRQLGAIYEHLLIFSEPKVATSNTSVDWHYLEPLENGRTRRRAVSVSIPAGSLYFEPEPAKRKETGTYYTPEYIVQYIVENTLGPVMDEREREFQRVLSKLTGKEKEANRAKSAEALQQLKQREIPSLEKKALETLLNVKVCDPAMGSGHFLVDACDFITQRILHILEKHPDNPVERKVAELRKELVNSARANGYKLHEEHLTTERLIQRLVLKRCIYGVDLNPLAVELAKLSLWLHCFTEGAPLSFLDHHLKCGNSLIGTRYVEIEQVLWKVGLFGRIPQDFSRMLNYLKVVSELADITLEQVRESARKYEESEGLLKPARRFFNAWLAEHFGHRGIQASLKGAKPVPTDWDKADENALPDWFRQVLEEARGRRFFHWELEFPEVFFDANGRKREEERGFDAVIGNPPYVTTLGRDERAYFFERSETRGRELDTFYLFVEQATRLLRRVGWCSMIIPNVFMLQVEAEAFRTYLLHHTILNLLDYGFSVFGEATVPTATFVLCKSPASNDHFVHVRLLSGATKIVKQSFFSTLPAAQFNVQISEALPLLNKVTALSEPLATYTESHEGVHSGNIRAKLFTRRPTLPCAKKMLKGSDIDRYSLEWGGWYVNYDSSLIDRAHGDYASLREERIFTLPKIWTRQTGDSIIATWDAEGFYSDNTLHATQLRQNVQISPLYLVAVLNSRLLTFVYQERTQERGRTLAQVKIVFLRQLPIRRIAFTTPADERARLVEEGKKLYNEMVEKMTRR